MTSAFARVALLLALALAGACGYHDTPVATYREPLPDPPLAGGSSGTGGGGAAAIGGSAVEAAGVGAGAGGEAGEPFAPPCMQSYPTTIEGSASRYKEVMIGATWAVAERDCELDGAHLIVISDEAENAWLKAFAEQQVTDSASTNQLAWLGLGDHASEGAFVWVTGGPISFAPWALKEPNSLNGYEDCVEIRATGEWNDDRCNARPRYVCECDGVLPVGNWCDTDAPETCGDCSTVCTAEQSCLEQECR